MLSLLLYSLALTHGVFAEVDCSKNAQDDCDTPALYSFIPTDILEYNKLCPQLTAYLRCLQGYEDQCGPEYATFRSKEEYEGTYGAYSDLCEEGKFLNRVATENLRCLNQTFRSTSCTEKADAVTRQYQSRSTNAKGEEEIDLPIKIMCLYDVLRSSCLVAEIGQKCGEEASVAAVEFISRIFFIEGICSKRTAEDLMKDLDKFTLDLEQKAVVIASLDTIIISDKK